MASQNTAEVQPQATTGGTLEALSVVDRFVCTVNDLIGLDGNSIRLKKGFAFPQVPPPNLRKLEFLVEESRNPDPGTRGLARVLCDALCCAGRLAYGAVGVSACYALGR